MYATITNIGFNLCIGNGFHFCFKAYGGSCYVMVALKYLSTFPFSVNLLALKCLSTFPFSVNLLCIMKCMLQNYMHMQNGLFGEDC